MRAARTLSWLGLLALAGAAGWAVLGGEPLPVATLVVVGVVLVGVDAGLGRAEAARSTELDLPEGSEPPPAVWWAGLLAGGLLGTTAGLVAGSAVAAGAGTLAVLAGLAGALSGLRARRQGPAPRAVAAARRVRAFARSHGAGPADPLDGYLVDLGGAGSRLVVVGPDGAWGDLVVPVGADGLLAARLARVALAEPDDRALTRSMRTGAPAWRRMTASL
ncbi:MAG TPA: hypothetical protein VK894_12575 [Jiangellales bacterium]|nr:hypothetical protein [Jiangellales bacterium]